MHFCDKIFTSGEYTERISTLSMMLEYRKNKLTEAEKGTDFV